MAEQINLEGTNWISNIPGVYFDATSQLVEKVGGEANAVNVFIDHICTCQDGSWYVAVNSRDFNIRREVA